MQAETRAITLKSVVKKIVTAIMSGNTHIGSSDVVPLVNYANMLGVTIPKLKLDPSRPGQYHVFPVAQLCEAVNEASGIPFTVDMVPDKKDPDQTAVEELLNSAIESKRAKASGSEEADEAKVDYSQFTEPQLLELLAERRIVRNQNGTRVSKSMAKVELVELNEMFDQKVVPVHCFAQSPEELEKPTREASPPDRVENMNVTQLRKELKTHGVDFDSGAKKTTLVALLKAHLESLTSDEGGEDEG